MQSLLLGGGGHRPEPRRTVFIKAMQDFLGKAVDRILFIPYALENYDKHIEIIRELGLDAGYHIEGIHLSENPFDAVAEARAIYVGGGNTFRLLHTLHQKGLVSTIRTFVQKGKPYIGVSAGTNIVCPTIATTNDMPIVWPQDLRALDLVPFQINPHFVSGTAHYMVDGTLIPYAGETREDRLREYHEMNDRPILAMSEGSILRVENRTVSLIGDTSRARLFQKGQGPRDYTPSDNLDFLFSSFS